MSFVGELYYAFFSVNENEIKYGKDAVDYLTHSNTNFPEEFSILNKNYPPAWQQESIQNNIIIKTNNITTNTQYRQFMTKNANDIIGYNFEKIKKE